MTNRLIQFRKRIAVYFENYAKHIDMLYEQKRDFGMLTQIVRSNHCYLEC
jgi:hypothetical protein